MPKAKSGVGRVFGEVVMGAATIFIIEYAIKLFLPPEYLTIYRVFTVIGMIFLLMAMKYWSTRYIMGWIIGLSFLFVISSNSIVGTWELMLYLGVPAVVLARRLVLR